MDKLKKYAGVGVAVAGVLIASGVISPDDLDKLAQAIGLVMAGLGIFADAFRQGRE